MNPDKILQEALKAVTLPKIKPQKGKSEASKKELETLNHLIELARGGDEVALQCLERYIKVLSK